MRDFVFTLNNYTEHELETIKSLTDSGKCNYIIFGKEIGANGTPHLQGYIEFPRDRQLTTLKRIPGLTRAHFEGRKGTQEQAISYCKKDGDWVEFGEKKSQGARNDLKEIVDRLKKGEISLDDIVLDYPMIYNQYHKTLEKALDIIGRSRKRNGEMPECIWLYGDSGSGKSHKAFEMGGDDAYVWADNNLWWDTYDGHKCLILNEFRGQIPYNQLLTLCDKWNTTVPRRGREPTPFIAEKIIVTSVLKPEEIYKNLAQNDSLDQIYRRFKFYRCERHSVGGITTYTCRLDPN